VVSDTALVGSSSNSDVSLFSPGGVPRVLNNVVASDFVSDQGNCVVKR